MKTTPCNDYFFVLDRVKPITEGVIESWLVGAEPKFRDIIDGKVRQRKSNIINHVRFTLKGMIYTGKVVTKGEVCILYIPLPLLPPFQYLYIMPFRVNLTWFMMLDLHTNLCCRTFPSIISLNLGSAPTSHDSITPSVIGFTLSRTKK